jgi:hypothetical protein
MPIIINGTVSASGLRGLVEALRRDARMPDGVAEGLYVNTTLTAFSVSPTSGERFRIEGSVSDVDAAAAISAVDKSEWTSVGGDEFGPILRGECELQPPAERSRSRWPRPSRHPPPPSEPPGPIQAP